VLNCWEIFLFLNYVVFSRKYEAANVLKRLAQKCSFTCTFGRALQAYGFNEVFICEVVAIIIWLLFELMAYHYHEFRNVFVVLFSLNTVSKYILYYWSCCVCFCRCSLLCFQSCMAMPSGSFMDTTVLATRATSPRILPSIMCRWVVVIHLECRECFLCVTFCYTVIVLFSWDVEWNSK